jgi:hypothetical protein
MNTLSTNQPDNSYPITITPSTCSSYNQTDCASHGCHWWNSSCHGSAPLCMELDNPTDCTAYNCYWWGSPPSCHAEPMPCASMTQAECVSPCSWWCGSCNDVALTEILDQKQETFGLNDWVGFTRCHAQSFIPTVSTITKIELNLFRQGNITAGLVVDIRDQITDMTLPPILRIIVPYDKILTTQGWYIIDLNLIGTCCPVTPNATHYMLLYSENFVGSTANCYKIGGYSGTISDNKYLNGQLYYTGLAGTTWQWSSSLYYDDMFRIYGM